MKTSKIFGLFIAIFMLQSCSKKSASDFDSDYSLYKDYITSFSSGFVSVNSDFRVQLAFNKSDWKPNQELDDDLFDISPSVSGKVVALSNNTIFQKKNWSKTRCTKLRFTFPKSPIKCPKNYRILTFR